MSYEYDLFISYRRSYTRGKNRVESRSSLWVKEVFFPQLSKLWFDERGESRIFVDTDEIRGGVRWRQKLAEAIRHSRCLVPVWTPPYFGSRWCLAEWQAMTARELQQGIPATDTPGLVVPVRFHDGDSFPSEARERQHHDFVDHSDLREPHLNLPPGLEFMRRLREELLPDLVAAVDGAPPWQDNFPPMSVADDDPKPPIITLPGMSP